MSYERGEQWVRLWLDARQDGSDASHIPLFTGLATSPAVSINGIIRQNSLECYSVLKPADDVPLPRGYFVASGNDVPFLVKIELLRDTPAPIVIDGEAPLLAKTIFAENGESKLSLAVKLLTAINWRFRIDGDGTIHICPKDNTIVASFDALDNDVVEPQINVEQDWYRCPNVFQAIIDGVAYTARDDNPNSVLSTISRGREIWVTEENPTLNSGETATQYVNRRLREEQTAIMKASYNRRFYPSITIGDCISLNFPAQKVVGVFRIASNNFRIKNDLLEAINASQKKTSAYDTEAEVVRIEGNTAWVHIGGGVPETPVQLTINAKKGDKVQVRVSNEGAWIMGNATAPPTDDTKAIVAERKAVVAETKATEAKEESAEAIVQATEAKADATEAVIKANGSVASDTIHYLATSASSGVTINTQGWTTTIQTIDAQKRYLWTYHTYTKANGATTNTQPVITGTFGVDGTSVTILGSYDTLAELQTAHPTGQLGDAYMVAGDLYVWNGTAWKNVGQIQGPKGDTGSQGTSVTAVINYYLASPYNTGITRESTGWTTTIQTMTATNQYLWNYEIVKGTGNVTLNTTDPIIIGRYGQNGTNGTNGISVTAVQPQYYLSTSASSATGGSWGNTLVYESGKYIWTRDAITYSNNTTGYSTAIYNSALTSACVNALNALQIAEDTNQYFWHTESGTDTGAHITEIPQEDFIADPANGGGNLLARSNGIAVRDGLVELAQFSANEVAIGQDENNRTSMTPTKFEVMSNGQPAFTVQASDEEGYTRISAFPSSHFTSNAVRWAIRPSISFNDIPNGTEITYRIYRYIYFAESVSPSYGRVIKNKAYYDFTFTKGTSKTVTTSFDFVVENATDETDTTSLNVTIQYDSANELLYYTAPNYYYYEPLYPPEGETVYYNDLGGESSYANVLTELAGLDLRGVANIHGKLYMDVPIYKTSQYVSFRYGVQAISSSVNNNVRTIVTDGGVARYGNSLQIVYVYTDVFGMETSDTGLYLNVGDGGAVPVYANGEIVSGTNNMLDSFDYVGLVYYSPEYSSGVNEHFEMFYLSTSADRSLGAIMYYVARGGLYAKVIKNNMLDVEAVIAHSMDATIDSLWQGATLSSRFTYYDSTSTVQYKRIGNVVYVRGVVKPTSAIAGSDTRYVIFNLPVGYRPAYDVYTLCQGSSANKWLLTVNINGNVCFSRYGTSSYAQASTSAWLPFNVSFAI